VKKLKSVNIWQSFKQKRDCLVHFLRHLTLSWPVAQSAWDNHAVACNFHRFKKITHTLSNKPFLIWLITTPPHLKYVAALPCNVSLMACFADINVSQGSVVTHARCGGIFNIHLTANLPRHLLVKNCKSVKIWENYGHESYAPFYGPPSTFCYIWKSLSDYA